MWRLLAVAFVLCPAPLRAQTDPAERQTLGWFGYFVTVPVAPKWSVVGEYQERRWGAPHQTHQRLFRGHLHRTIAPGVMLAGGFTYFMQGSQDPRRSNELLVPELRPHVQLEVKQPLTDRWALAHRARAEFRAFRLVEDGDLIDEYRLAGRFRYRLGVDRSLGSKSAPTLKLSSETMVMLGDRDGRDVFDQHRLQFGMLTPVTKSIGVELAYLWWHQRVPGREDAVNRDIARIIVHHRLGRTESPADRAAVDPDRP